MAIDPVSAVGAGASLLGGVVGAFGGVDQKRIVDPYVKQAVEFQDQALDYARNTRDSQISAAYQFGDQASNQTQQMIGGQMMNKTGRSDGAFVGGMGNAMRALSRNNALGAVGQAHQAYQGQINQTAQGRLNAAAQVMYQAEPDFLTKLGAGLTGVTSNAANGAANAKLGQQAMTGFSQQGGQ